MLRIAGIVIDSQGKPAGGSMVMLRTIVREFHDRYEWWSKRPMARSR
jgi:hypothetical protein